MIEPRHKDSKVTLLAAEETTIRALTNIITTIKLEIGDKFPCRCEVTGQGLQQCLRCICLKR